MEVGPWRVDGQGGLKMVAGGWDEYTNIVFGAFGVAGTLRRATANYAMDAQSTSQRVLASPTQAPIGTLLNSPMYAHACPQSITCNVRLTPPFNQVAKHFVQFMRNFYDVFPEFKNIDVRSRFFHTCH